MEVIAVNRGLMFLLAHPQDNKEAYRVLQYQKCFKAFK